MNDYRYVCEFKLLDKTYAMFMDQYNKRFFVRKDGDSYSYITAEELFKIVEALYHSDNVYDVNNDKNEIRRIIPKIIIASQAAALIPPILLTACFRYFNTTNRIKEIIEGNYKNSITESSRTSEEITSEYINRYLSVAEQYVKDGSNVDTYLVSDLVKFKYIYDMNYVDLVYEKKNVTVDDLIDVINSNNDIPDSFKPLLVEYCTSLCSHYKNIELRPFYENLKTLKVIECTKNELMLKSLNADSDGCYIRTENSIYIPEGNEYKKGTWPYQVIFHELSHCVRTHHTVIDGYQIRVDFEGLNYYNIINAEALNSLFAISLFDYKERDVAYQLQSNYHSVILECVDNYDLSDYINHSLSYYVNKLDEYNNEKGAAPVILELIELQYDDFHNKNITINQEEFYPIYDYISKMYFDKYLHEGMSYDEMRKIADDLVDKVMFDVPKDYNIDSNYFYKYFNNYVEKKGFFISRSR